MKFYFSYEENSLNEKIKDFLKTHKRDIIIAGRSALVTAYIYDKIATADLRFNIYEK